VLRNFFLGVITLNTNLRRRYNKELMQLFGDLDIASFFRTRRLNLIGNVNRMDSRRNVSQLFKNNPQEG